MKFLSIAERKEGKKNREEERYRKGVMRPINMVRSGTLEEHGLEFLRVKVYDF